MTATRVLSAFVLAWSAAIALVSARADTAIGAQEIIWTRDRPLRWEDFRASTDPSVPSERVALTAASLSWGYDYKVDRVGQDCSYRIRGVHAEAIFDPAKSWVRPGHRTAGVLAHEQGHFDITEIYRVNLEERARELVGRANRCDGDTLEAAMASTKRRAAEQMAVIFDEVWQEYLAVQELYDAQTQHGVVAEAQRHWTDGIDRGLRRRQWERFISNAAAAR